MSGDAPEAESSPAIDVLALERWMSEVDLGAGPIVGLQVLAGGTQNVIVKFTRDDREYVLRRSPAYGGAHHDELIRREARVLATLADSRVPHPRVIAACDSGDVLGAAFYLMESVDGFNPADTNTEPYGGDPDMQRAMSLSLVDALATLSEVDPFAAGLATPERALQWRERQVARWISQLNSYEQFARWPSGALSSLDDVQRHLSRVDDVGFQPGLIHGDFHVGNVMFRHEQPVVAAVIDWELATFGDPLLDLGHLLATWPRANARRSAATVLDLPGFVPAGALVEQYALKASRHVEDLDWYYSLACLRLGVLLEGTFARACAGLVEMEVGAHFHDMTVALFEQALHPFDW